MTIKCEICGKELSDDEWGIIYGKKICSSRINNDCKNKALMEYNFKQNKIHKPKGQTGEEKRVIHF